MPRKSMNKRTKKEREYNVEKIVDMRKIINLDAMEYLIKWKGYSSRCNTWEPVSNLKNCKSILNKYVTNRIVEEMNRSSQFGLSSDQLSQNVMDAVKYSTSLAVRMRWVGPRDIPSVSTGVDRKESIQTLIQYYESRVKFTAYGDDDDTDTEESENINAKEAENCEICFGNVDEENIEDDENNPKPQKIISVYVISGLIYFVLNYGEYNELIYRKFANMLYPELVIKFYETLSESFR